MNVIIDNSVLMNQLTLTDQIETFVDDLATFANNHPHQSKLELGMYSFEGLEIATVKDYSSSQLKPVPKNGFPLMNRMLHTITNRYESHIQSRNETESIDYFKPWLIIISSGLGFDKIDFFETYKPTQKNLQPVIFPFIVTKDYLMFDISKINQVKPFIPLKDFNLGALKDWIKSMINQRLSIPDNEGLRLSKEMFEGWTQL